MADEPDEKPEGNPPPPTTENPPPPPPPASHTTDDHVTRAEFSQLTTAFTELTSTVKSLVDNLNPAKNTKPVGVPWTHAIGRKRTNDE